jgi:hypothetical protein
MCGIKQTYVCIEEEELIRLKYNEARLHAMNSAPREKINHIRHDIEEHLKEKLERINRRQTEYEQYVYDLNGTLRHFEIETQHRFSEQNRKLDLLRQEYFSLLRMERDEYLSIFETQEKKLKSLLEEAKLERQQVEISQQNKINSLLKENSLREKVKNFTEELAGLICETIKIPHQQFAPGKFDKIRDQLQTAGEDYNNGFFETALSTARSVYWQLVELRADVLQKEHELITLSSAVMEVLGYLIEKAALNRKRKLDFGQGNTGKEIEIDIDYWTQGQFSYYESEMKSYQRELLKDEKKISIEQLKDLIRQIEKSELQFSRIMESARENILASQLRANVAQKTAQALKEQLFSVEDSAYEGNDPRNSYFLKLKNRAGNEIVAVIKPVEGQFGKNEISLHFYDNKLPNQNAFHDRALEITTALGRQGLEVGSPQTVNTVPKPEFRDLEKVRKGRMSLLDLKSKT